MKNRFLFMMIAFILGCNEKPVTVTGHVTYEWGEIKNADPYAEIFIINKDHLIGTKSEGIFHEFLSLSINRVDYRASVAFDKDDTDVLKTKIDTIQSSLYLKIRDVENNPLTLKITSDQDANFSTELLPGSYYIIARSKKLSDLNILDYEGRVHISPLTVEKRKLENIFINIK